MIEPPKLPDYISVGKRYENNPRFEMVKDAWLYFGTRLADDQHQMHKKEKKERAHEGLLVAIVDPVGNTIRHADQMNESPLGEDHLLTPLKSPEEEEDQYNKRLDEYFDKIEALGILHEPFDGGLVVARDGTLLAAGVYFQAQDCDKQKLHKGYGTRHRAALASSYLNEYLWLMVLSEEDNNLRIYKDGDTKKIYDPTDKDKPAETAV
jgi:hypothetical protein